MRAASLALAAALAAALAGCSDDGAGREGTGSQGADVPGARAPSGVPAPSAGWPTYGGEPGQTRHSSLAAIDTGNVGRLEPAWSHRTGVPGVFEATPLVVDGALYLTTPMSDGEQRVQRLDAATGRLEWERRIELDRPRPYPAGANRGVALEDGRVFVGTLDARLMALDARTGEVLWETRTADPARGHSHKQAPLVHDGVVYTGASGGPFGIRGFVKAFRAASGEELWTWHSIPAPEEGGWWGRWVDTLPGTDLPLPREVAAERRDSARHADAWRRGGAAVWMTPTLDPERGLLYVSVGNPAPELTDTRRPGDNRWSVSVCAIRASDGDTAWCDQYLPHDLWGYDAASPPFLFTLGPGTGEGGAAGRAPGDAGGEGGVPAVGHFSKLGRFYAWDRRSGERLTVSEPYVPTRNYLARPTPEGVLVAPGIYGGTEWSPAAWSPATGLAYAANVHAPGRYFVRTSGDRAGTVGFTLVPPGRRDGSLVAMEPGTGEVAWRARTEQPMVGGVLSTAGGLVFAGRLSGSLDAWHARTGRRLWSGSTGAGCASGPVTYRAGGRQLVAVACGGHFLGGESGDRLVAFALPGGEEVP